MNKLGNADSHFVIGRKHITQNFPCQDHALSDSFGDDALIVVVSDGCSSGRHTDIGSRIITCSAIAAVKELLLAMPYESVLLPDEIHTSIVKRSQSIAAMMGLENVDLLATCVYAILTPTGGFVHIIGDGHAVIRYKDGRIRVINADWQNNTPYYPGDNRKSAFIAEHSQTAEGKESLRISVNDTAEAKSGETFVGIEDAVKGHVVHITAEELAMIDVVAVTTDGIGSFKKDMSLLDPFEVVQPLTAFKNWTGEFVKRRLSKGMVDFSKESTIPYDDVAIAAIHITLKSEESWTAQE